MKNIYTFFIVLVSLPSYTQINAYGDTIEGAFNNFENQIDFIEISLGVDNLWEIGTPSKIHFNSAYSPNKAISTDTMDSYPVNNHSYFDLYITQANMPWYPYQMQIEFMHIFDTDTMLDGGYITISYDKGQTWKNIIDDDSWYYDVSPYQGWDGSNTNIYSQSDTLFNGEKGYSGRSSGWVKTNLSWVIYPVKSVQESLEDTTILRFNFISDDIDNNKEGWMIDDIRMYTVDLGSNVNNLSNANEIIYPNPAKDYFTVEYSFTSNNKPIVLKVTDVQGKVLYTKELQYKHDQLVIDASDYPKGTYYISLFAGQKVIKSQALQIDK